MNTRKIINKRRLKTVYTKRKNSFLKKYEWKFTYRYFLYAIWFFVGITILMCIILYFKYIKDLPSIKELENLEIAESTTIYDREWWELYKIYKEKRTYIPYEEINKNMVNALVAWEDKRYWENSWIDLIWLFRAVLYRAIWKTDKLEATSTLTQQLIKNTILTSERKIERKIKEMYLSYRLSSWVSKEKILELYLNKISFWHNSYGIEQAAKTFFWKKAKDLWILESSILASLPKWPTYYSPYNHPDRTLWYPYFYTTNSENSTKIISKNDKEKNKEILNALINFFTELKATRLEWTNKILVCNLDKKNFKKKLDIDKDWCSIFEYSALLNFLNWIKIKKDDSYIEYQTWRKDFILWRMLEDKYIEFDDYKKSLINSIWYEFSQEKQEITAPHFVFFVKEFLEKKYWQEMVESWWLKVYTTLDPKLQEKAEELVNKQWNLNEQKYWADNAAMISIDNKTWEILAMVWWRDYFDKDNKWNVNIITSKLQPWSTFKPFVYSIWIFKNEIWSKTPIYDLKTNFPSWYTPKDFDWSFLGKMNISTALNSSRNIPAIKMFYLAWWEKSVVDFMRKLWVTSLNTKNQYWAPLALWTWELTPLELASAYTVFANLWVKKEITPILKILDSKWNIIEERKEIKQEKVFSEAQAYIMNTILSDTTTRPAWWNPYLVPADRKVAVKTWTSTKQYNRNWKKEIFPANLWTISYTPSITTVWWVWNTDWSEVSMKADWLNCVWPMVRDFMTFAHKWKVAEFWKRPATVKEVSISEISWLLPNPEIENNNFIVKSLFVNVPTKYDNSYKRIEVDALCNWKVTENTPEAAIKKVTLLELHSLNPENPNWENPVKAWALSNAFIEKYWNVPNLVTELSTKTCDRTWDTWEIIIKSKIIDWDSYIIWENSIELAYRSNNPIKKVDVLLNNEVVDEIFLKNKLEWAYAWTFNIPKEYVWNNVKIKIRAVDTEYNSSSEEKTINIIEKDLSAPEIILENPIDWSIKLYNDTFFNLKAEIKDKSTIRTITIKIDNVIETTWLTSKNLSYSINSNKNITVWNHIITIEAIDKDFNKSTKDINLEVLQR